MNEIMSIWMDVLKTKYAKFDGRARRKEYWYFTLVNIIIGIIIGILSRISTIFLVLDLYWLAVLIPGIAVAIRRLHDIGKSGWFLLLGLIPIIGALILLYFYVLDSQPGENQYGSNPKGI
ncbi:MAG: DUF805 domain-containing protein [Desulfuromonadales bacterium]|nr:DUF805 domain-containing protein [Desulfuromonadales bacterium]